MIQTPHRIWVVPPCRLTHTQPFTLASPTLLLNSQQVPINHRHNCQLHTVGRVLFQFKLRVPPPLAGAPCLLMAAPPCRLLGPWVSCGRHVSLGWTHRAGKARSHGCVDVGPAAALQPLFAGDATTHALRRGGPHSPRSLCGFHVLPYFTERLQGPHSRIQSQGSNPDLLHLLNWQMGSLTLAPPGKPKRELGVSRCCVKTWLIHISVWQIALQYCN